MHIEHKDLKEKCIDAVDTFIGCDERINWERFLTDISLDLMEGNPHLDKESGSSFIYKLGTLHNLLRAIQDINNENQRRRMEEKISALKFKQ